jgi:membrane-associated protease RseP (regulator of RpoE activity)
VKNFSIGFGPPLLSYKQGDPEDEDAIEYTVRAIPAGGFVSFPQHYEVDDDGEIIRCVRACVRVCVLWYGWGCVVSNCGRAGRSSCRVIRYLSSPPTTNHARDPRYEDKDLLQNRPPLQQALVISAGVIANVLLSFSLLLGTVTTAGLPRPQFAEGPYVMKLVEKDCPAAQAGILPEDLILAVGGRPD